MVIQKLSKTKKESPRAEIGILGGSGFYSLFEKGKEVIMKTPYGAPSDKISLSEIEGRQVAFLPRHGRQHSLPPHRIPYLANLRAFKKLGVQRIIAPAACGSLKPNIKPGDFVVCDQFVDRTKNRVDTFYSGSKTVHLGCSQPYCPQMRALAIDSCKRLKIPVHKQGTVVVIEGPRFSTKAESQWFKKSGFEVINMTQYPEVVLARELEMCYVNISLITDYDAGLVGRDNVKAVDAATVIKVFRSNIKRVRALILEMIKSMPPQRECACGQALAQAEF